MNAFELKHPLVEHKLSILRNEKTGTKEFRELISELATFLCFEAMKDAELDEVVVKTPMCKTKGKMLNEDKYAFVSISTFVFSISHTSYKLALNLYSPLEVVVILYTIFSDG